MHITRDDYFREHINKNAYKNQIIMGRTPLPIDERKKLFNCKLSPEVYQRMRVICFRRSISQMKKYSEGQFISEQINATPMPLPPTAQQIKDFLVVNPVHKKLVAGLLKLAVPKTMAKTS